MDPAVVTKPNLNSFCSELLSVVSSRSALLLLLLVMLGLVVVEETCCCLLLWLAAVVAVADVIVVASLVARVEVSSSGALVEVEKNRKVLVMHGGSWKPHHLAGSFVMFRTWSAANQGNVAANAAAAGDWVASQAQSLL